MGNRLIAVGTELMRLGLFGSGPDRSGLVGSRVAIVEIQTVARELLRLRRDKIGADHMGEIIAGTPGLSQFA